MNEPLRVGTSRAAIIRAPHGHALNHYYEYMHCKVCPDCPNPHKVAAETRTAKLIGKIANANAAAIPVRDAAQLITPDLDDDLPDGLQKQLAVPPPNLGDVSG